MKIIQFSIDPFTTVLAQEYMASAQAVNVINPMVVSIVKQSEDGALDIELAPFSTLYPPNVQLSFNREMLLIAPVVADPQLKEAYMSAVAPFNQNDSGDKQVLCG